MMKTPQGTVALTTYADLEPYHLGRSDVVACTCGRHPVPFIYLDKRTAELYREFRRLGGDVPRAVNSSSRCLQKQADLYDLYNGISPVATAKNSTHVALLDGKTIVRPCVAIDVTNDGSLSSKIRDRDQFRQAGLNLWGKAPRIGWNAYQNGVCHADTAFFLPWLSAHVPGAEW